MSVFDFATVAVSFILAFAVSTMLESAVGVFRARGRCRLHLLPFIWAGCVLVEVFQFWWALYELSALPTMSVGVFALLLSFAALLYLASATVLPGSSEALPGDLLRYFIVDGSWAAGALALYNLSVVLGNVVLFEVPVLETANLFNAALAGLALMVALTRRYAWQIGLTAAFVIVLAIGVVLATPAEYESTAGLRVFLG